MSRLWHLTRIAALVAVFGSGFCTWSSLHAEGTTKPESKTEEAKLEDQEDIYTLPENGTTEELISAITALKEFEPTSRAAYIAHTKKAPDVLKSAAEQILKLEKDPQSDNARFAHGVLLELEASAIRNATPEEKAALFNKAKEYISTSKLSEAEFSLALDVAMGLEYGKAHDLATKAYTEFGEMLQKSKDADVAESAQILFGAARRLNLVGQPLQLKGKTLDGEDFNIEDLKGKVVLVDFWATWCGPCLKEYPNILRHYEAYHDKGFEVVGVSLDANRGALQKYVSEKHVPWPTLHDKEARGRHPAANYYGIIGIPAVILLNKDGNVISLNAYGDELGKLLEQELGPAEVKRLEVK